MARTTTTRGSGGLTLPQQLLAPLERGLDLKSHAASVIIAEELALSAITQIPDGDAVTTAIAVLKTRPPELLKLAAKIRRIAKPYCDDPEMFAKMIRFTYRQTPWDFRPSVGMEISPERRTRPEPRKRRYFPDDPKARKRIRRSLQELI